MKKIGKLLMLIGIVFVGIGACMCLTATINLKQKDSIDSTMPDSVESYLLNKYGNNFEKIEKYDEFFISTDGGHANRRMYGEEYFPTNDYISVTSYTVYDKENISFLVNHINYIGDISKYPDKIKKEYKEGYLDNYPNALMFPKVEEKIKSDLTKDGIILSEFSLKEGFNHRKGNYLILKDDSMTLDKIKKMNVDEYMALYKRENYYTSFELNLDYELNEENIKEELKKIVNITNKYDSQICFMYTNNIHITRFKRNESIYIKRKNVNESHNSAKYKNLTITFNGGKFDSPSYGIAIPYNDFMKQEPSNLAFFDI